MTTFRSEPWADFLAARLRLIHQWWREGKTPEQIARDLNHHDTTQIRLLLMTDAEAPIPCSVYEQVTQLEAKVETREAEISRLNAGMVAAGKRIAELEALVARS